MKMQKWKINAILGCFASFIFLYTLIAHTTIAGRKEKQIMGFLLKFEWIQSELDRLAIVYHHHSFLLFIFRFVDVLWMNIKQCRYSVVGSFCPLPPIVSNVSGRCWRVPF